MATYHPNRKVNMELQSAIETVLRERPLAYHASLAKALGSVTAGVFLSQLLYWMPRSQNGDGWVWKTRDEIYQETALSRFEQENARRVLKTAGVLEERRAGMPARMYFRVNMERLISLLAEAGGRPRGGEGMGEQEEEASASQSVGNQPTSWRKSSQQDGGNPANKMAGFPQSTPYITKTTTENTSENTTTLGKSGVVARLKDLGMSKSAAYRMVSAYAETHIVRKLDQVQWLMEHQPGAVAKNPAGYLRRAIEEDYAPPPGYQTPEQRAAEEAEAARIRQAAEAQRKAEEEKQQLARENIASQIASQYPEQFIPGTALTTSSAWEQVLRLIAERNEVTRTVYETWLKDSRWLWLEGETAYIGVANRWIAQQVERQLYTLIALVIADVTGRAWEVEFIAIDELSALPKGA